MKRLSAIAIAILTMAACGGGGTTGGPAKLRFAIIPKALDIPVFNYAKVGAEREAAKRGNIDVIWRGPENADQLRQKEILESFITQRVDGIAISCLNGDFLTDTIDRAIDAGIPVVTWDADAPRSKRISFYGVDDLAAGRTVNLQRRLDGVREALARHPGIQVVEVYDIKEDPVRCAEIIASGTNRYPDLGAWISVGGWPVFTRNALDSVPPQTKVISFDTIPPAPDLLKAGKVQVLLGQKYFGWGSESVRLLAEIKAGSRPAPIIDSGVDLVTPGNVDQYVLTWKAMEKQ